jgi:indole-3-glycerol phosphate synthase
MSTVLDKICAEKREHVAQCKADISLARLHDIAAQQALPRGFAQALETSVHTTGYALISEIKKASPSAGLIRPDFHPKEIAQAYAAGGAACLSVLTDIPYFQGNDSYVQDAHDAVALPILRKDFMIDVYQVVEARALAADCILIIMAAVDDALAKDLEDAALNLGMDCLIEVHSRTELERALKLKSELIGVNNRNLKTLETRLENGLELLPLIPKGRSAVAESGLYTAADLRSMAVAGARRFLIGESLMRQDDITAAVRTLLADPLPL